MDCSIPGFSPSITNSQSLLKLVSIESAMPSNHLILITPFSSCPQSLPASGSFPMSCLFVSGASKGVPSHYLSLGITIWHRKGDKKWKGCLGPHTGLNLRDLSPQWTTSEEVTFSPHMLTPSTLANDDTCLLLSGCQVLPPLDLGTFCPGWSLS